MILTLHKNRTGSTILASIGLAIVFSLFVGFTADGYAQAPAADVPGAEVLTRGPVHEAFAEMVAFNPEPGLVVSKAPPVAIEEVPPEERPEGDNVTWIPGYWAWDDERSDFLWISGTWRALPPGRQWVPGYWAQTSAGYQWTSGYWADAAAQETTYLPQPPASVEAGPNIAAPSVDYGWTPGCWIWYQGRYAWRPGYWAQGRADWDWCPAHYVWTPRGHIFVGGFWDYPVERRGILFAPVYFERSVYARRGYFYSPSIVIDLGVFTEHLFLRPRYQHYYFGDYYAPAYFQGGFYASFSFQSGRHGYDPIYSHQRWEHRHDREWERRVSTSYDYRRDHETARPPRTWAAQRSPIRGNSQSRQTPVRMAMPISQLSKRKDGPIRFQPVATEERQQLVQRGQQVQESRDQRRTMEAESGRTAVRNSAGTFEPAKMPLPRSPIVGKSASQFGKNQAPPQAQRAAQLDPKSQPGSRPSVRQPNTGQRNSQPQPRQIEPQQRPTPRRSEPPLREKPAQPAPAPRVRKPEATVPQPSPQNERPARLESQREAESQNRANAAAAEASQDAQRSVQGLERKPDPEPRAQDSAAKARPGVQRNAVGLERKAGQGSERLGRERPDAREKGATRLLRKRL